MHTNIRIQRYMYTCIHAYMHEFIHKEKPPIITSTTDKGENDIHSFIQSGYFYSASSRPILSYAEALPTTVIECRSLHDEAASEALQVTVYNIYIIQYIIIYIIYC